MVTQTFNAGQLVRINNHRQSAYGRVAMITGSDGNKRSLVRFVDLPKEVSASADPTGLVRSFTHKELTPIDDIPLAGRYLLITVMEYKDGACYQQHCLAHGNSEDSEIANAVAQNWYASTSKWDEKKQSYVFAFDPDTTVAADDWESIPLAEYVNLRRWLKDCTPGYAPASYSDNTEADYIRRQTSNL